MGREGLGKNQCYMLNEVEVFLLYMRARTLSQRRQPPVVIDSVAALLPRSRAVVTDAWCELKSEEEAGRRMRGGVRGEVVEVGVEDGGGQGRVAL